MEDKIILQVNIENKEDFKHIIKSLSNMEKLGLIEYLNLIREQLRNDLNFDFGDIKDGR